MTVTDKGSMMPYPNSDSMAFLELPSSAHFPLALAARIDTGLEAEVCPDLGLPFVLPAPAPLWLCAGAYA